MVPLDARLPLATLRRRILRVPTLMLVLALFGIAIRREAISSGFFADDYAQLGMVDGSYPLPREPYDLFTFSNGTRAEGERLMRVGFYPWWADPSVRISMFRPLASLMTGLDFRLFGAHARGYHLHSLAWWLALLAIVAFLYRRWLSPPAALVAFALFVCDESHGLALGWICNRSAIISSLLALGALHFYTRFRETQRARDRSLALICMALALGFGEYAICALGYFFAYEILRATGPFRERLRALSPIVGLSLVYAVARGLTGSSMQRSGLYVDALTEPFGFAAALVARLPVLIGDLLLALHADYWTFGTPYVRWAVDSGWVSSRWLHDLEPWRVVQSAIGVFACIALAWLWSVHARERESHGRWLLAGSVFALLPVCGSLPSSRLTLVAAFGFMPFLAEFLTNSWQRLRPRRVREIAFAVVALSLVGYHLIAPTLFERDESIRIREFTRRVRLAALQLPVQDAALRRKDLVLLAAPEVGTSMYLPLTRHRYGRSVPRACWYLSLAPVPYVLARRAPDAFTMRFAEDGSALETPHEQLLRSPQRPLRVGEVVNVGGFRATILQLFEGRPKLIDIQFDRPLEDPSLLFMLPTPRGYRHFAMPPIGDSVVVRAAFPDPPDEPATDD